MPNVRILLEVLTRDIEAFQAEVFNRSQHILNLFLIFCFNHPMPILPFFLTA
jgi:hypothetical protein